MRKYPIDTPTDRTQLCDGRLLDGNSTWKIFTAVKKASCSVKRVARVVDSGTLEITKRRVKLPFINNWINMAQ